MASKERNNRLKKIEFKLVEIRKINHFENDPSEFGLKADDLNSADIEMKVELGFDGDNGIISFNIKVTFHFPPEERKYKLFGIETLYKYKVKNLKQFQKSEDQYNIPDGPLITFLNIAISGTRGMLAGLNTTPAYNKMLLPLVHPSELVKTLKGKKVSQKQT